MAGSNANITKTVALNAGYIKAQVEVVWNRDPSKADLKDLDVQLQDVLMQIRKYIDSTVISPVSNPSSPNQSA